MVNEEYDSYEDVVYAPMIKKDLTTQKKVLAPQSNAAKNTTAKTQGSLANFFVKK